jgi:hypothetical protein
VDACGPFLLRLGLVALFFIVPLGRVLNAWGKPYNMFGVFTLSQRFDSSSGYFFLNLNSALFRGTLFPGTSLGRTSTCAVSSPAALEGRIALHHTDKSGGALNQTAELSPRTKMSGSVRWHLDD